MSEEQAVNASYAPHISRKSLCIRVSRVSSG